MHPTFGHFHKLPLPIPHCDKHTAHWSVDILRQRHDYIEENISCTYEGTMNQQCACQGYFIINIIIIICFLLTLKPGIRRLERREEVAQGAGVSRALAVNRGGADVFNRALNIS